MYRLGFMEQTRRHLCLPGHQPDPIELQKLQTLEKHLKQCTDARKIEDWKSALFVSNAAIEAVADCSPQVNLQCLVLYRITVPLISY